MFDAVGTLIDPDPPAAEVYWRVGQRFGSRLTLAEVRMRFRDTWRASTAADSDMGWRTSAEREHERWRAIVPAVLPDADAAACFDELWHHFARPDSWCLRPEVGRVIPKLRRHLTVGIASNFDSRLHAIVRGFSDLADLPKVLVSSEIGWRKPAGEFFAAMVRAIGAAPHEILYVGDDPDCDVEAARAAGLQAAAAQEFFGRFGNLTA